MERPTHSPSVVRWIVVWLCACNVPYHAIAARPASLLRWTAESNSMPSASDVTASAPVAGRLALRPPMGWNSWNHFGCSVTEGDIRSAADNLVSSGLAALGYTYVNIDDCWQAQERDSQGGLQADPTTFPSGIKALADYVHQKGLKFGIYSDAGYKTCAGRPGSFGHEEKDAATFASWDVDYLKYDNCAPGPLDVRSRYGAMHRALLETGRSIVFSMCEWGVEDPATWARSIADTWRTTFDIKDNWKSMMNIADQNNQWASFAAPGGWNDPDMLEVGNGGMTKSEYRVHFSLWVIMKAPLLIGCDLAKVSREALDILGNDQAIAINQDALGVQASMVQRTPIGDVWSGALSDSRAVVAIVNRQQVSVNWTLAWKDINLQPGAVAYAEDVWTNVEVHTGDGESLRAEIAAHDVLLLVLHVKSGRQEAVVL